MRTFFFGLLLVNLLPPLQQTPRFAAMRAEFAHLASAPQTGTHVPRNN